MTLNEARKIAVDTIVQSVNDGIVRRTEYGFTFRVGHHDVRFSAQAECEKHKPNVVAKSQDQPTGIFGDGPQTVDRTE